MAQKVLGGFFFSCVSLDSVEMSTRVFFRVSFYFLVFTCLITSITGSGTLALLSQMISMCNLSHSSTLNEVY